MTTLAVMAAGILAGRVFPAGQKSNNERLQLLCTLLLIFSMGVSLGQREDFFSELALLGAQALLFFLLPTVCSILLVYALTRRFLPESSPRTAGPETGGAPAAAGRAPDPMLFLALGSLVLGVLCGTVPAAARFLAPLAGHSDWVLLLLMFSVGISVGLHRGIWAKVRQYHVRLLVIPAGIVAGSLAGGVLCGLLVGCPPRLAAAVAGGLGWYSLAGVTITNLAGAELGSIAFLSNLMREIGSFFAIPLIARHLNSYTCIAPAAATSEDTTLPMLVRYTSEETVVFAVLNGILCSALVPVLISLFC